jgi:amino acid adenylation domain-containing protein
MVNSTRSDAPLIHEAVGLQAARRPEATALRYRGNSITYATLDAAACAYASELAARGLAAGQIVPMLMPRSPQSVALQLAVLKCGAAYTALDMRWPSDRTLSILDSISPALVIAESAADAGRFDGFIVPPDDDLKEIAAQSPGFDSPEISSASAATVFFTSGTTGIPKGVVVPHQGITRLFREGGMEGFGPGHATAQEAPQPWDMYAYELWGQLTAGGTTVLVDGYHLLPSTLQALIADDGVDTIYLTSSLFNLFVDEDVDCFAGLGSILIGGERASAGHARAFLDRHPATRLRNGYGPAEGSMVTTTHLIRPEDCEAAGGLPIGAPVPGARVLILGSGDQVCGSGEVGEICIAGQGLAIGYLGMPRLTEEKFPVVEVGDAKVRIYRSGDFGFYDESGILQFSGRRDRQVKVSGHRIEPAEIEIAACSVPGVRDCLALPLTAGNGDEITGIGLFYLTEPTDDGVSPPSDSGPPSDSDPLGVHKHLTEVLPHYMIPSVVNALERFPLTANGKVDRAALQDVAKQSRRRPSHMGSRWTGR